MKSIRLSACALLLLASCAMTGVPAFAATARVTVDVGSKDIASTNTLSVGENALVLVRNLGDSLPADLFVSLHDRHNGEILAGASNFVADVQTSVWTNWSWSGTSSVPSVVSSTATNAIGYLPLDTTNLFAKFAGLPVNAERTFVLSVFDTQNRWVLGQDDIAVKNTAAYLNLTNGIPGSIFVRFEQAISDLASHLADTNNPHGVTADGIGAIPKWPATYYFTSIIPSCPLWPFTATNNFSLSVGSYSPGVVLGLHSKDLAGIFTPGANLLMGNGLVSFQATNGLSVNGTSVALVSDIPDTSGLVSKSGDTMTGPLVVSNSDNSVDIHQNRVSVRAYNTLGAGGSTETLFLTPNSIARQEKANYWTYSLPTNSGTLALLSDIPPASGSGFPLTNNANFASFSATNVGSIQLDGSTNELAVVDGKLKYGGKSISGVANLKAGSNINLSTNSETEVVTIAVPRDIDFDDVTIRGDLIVAGVEYKTTTIYNQTNVNVGVRTNYYTEDVYTTNRVYQHVYVVERSTQYVAEVVTVGGNVDHSRAEWVMEPSFSIDNADTNAPVLTATGEWDFTHAVVDFGTNLPDLYADRVVQPMTWLTNGTIALQPDVSIYAATPDSGTTFEVDLTALGAPPNCAITFEMLLDLGASVSNVSFMSTNTLSWLDGDAPAIPQGARSLLVFRTYDTTNWIGNLQGILP